MIMPVPRDQHQTDRQAAFARQWDGDGTKIKEARPIRVRSEQRLLRQEAVERREFRYFRRYPLCGRQNYGVNVLKPCIHRGNETSALAYECQVIGSRAIASEFKAGLCDWVIVLASLFQQFSMNRVAFEHLKRAIFVGNTHVFKESNSLVTHASARCPNRGHRRGKPSRDGFVEILQHRTLRDHKFQACNGDRGSLPELFPS
jgi:hypothetical protein